LAAVASFAQPRPSTELRLFPIVAAWNTPLEAALSAPPRLSGHLAFVPLDGGHLTAYDLDSGEPVWSVDSRPLSVPAVGDDMLFVAEADAISALRQSDGHTVWRLPFSDTLADPIVWDNGWLVAAGAEGTLVALRASDGTLIWRKNLGSRINASPALAADRVYAPLADGHVVSLDVATGEIRWSRKLGGAANDMLALDDRLFVGSDDNFFYSLKTADGVVDWRWRTGGDVIGVPVVDDSRVYFVSKDNLVRGLDRRSGAQRWKRELPGRPTRGPVSAGDLLLVSGLSPKVTAFAMKDGAPAGDVTASGELAASPYVSMAIGLPQVVLVSRDVMTGTRLLAYRRNVEPTLAAQLPLLPNPIVVPRPQVEATP
jgi:outer membrane protein assembly factor BamB